MSDLALKISVIDLKTNSQIDSERIGTVPINDREHYGRSFITVATEVGNKLEHRNVGILNQDGSFEEQPGYKIVVE